MCRCCSGTSLCLHRSGEEHAIRSDWDIWSELLGWKRWCFHRRNQVILLFHVQHNVSFVHGFWFLCCVYIHTYMCVCILFSQESIFFSDWVILLVILFGRGVVLLRQLVCRINFFWRKLWLCMAFINNVPFIFLVSSFLFRKFFPSLMSNNEAFIKKQECSKDLFS